MTQIEKARIMMALQNKICQEEGIPLLYAGVIANEVLNHFDERVLLGAEAWLKGTLTPDFKVEGTSISDLQKETGASLFGALCILDTALRNPESMRLIRWAEWRDEIQ